MQLQFLGLVALASLVSAQQTNITATNSSANGSIYDLLTKNQQSYGATKFETLLKSDPAYEPVIDILSSPGNYTVFVPNDKAISAFLKDYKSQNKDANASALPQANSTYNNVTIADILKYHLIQGSYPLANLNSTVNVLETSLNNDTVYKLDNNATVLITNDVNCKTFLDSSWHTKNNNSIRWEIGNGNDEAAVVKKDIKASNGYLNIIDEVITPPLPPSQALEDESDVSTIYKYLSTHKNISDLIDSGSNFTIFAPSDSAIRKAKITDLSGPAMQELVKNHIVKGVYYTTNFTDSSNSSSTNTSASSTNSSTPSASNMTIITANGYSMPVSVKDCKVMLNNSATITEPNILLNNGVLHVIDRVFNATEPMGDATENDPFASSNATSTDATASTTDASADATSDAAAADATTTDAADATTTDAAAS